MKTRICPLCDQPMKKAHHCDSCNSFVWKPVYLDIHYSTDGAYETDCSYDAKTHVYEYHDNGSITMMPVKEKDQRGRKFRGVEEIEFSNYETASRDYKKAAAAPTQKNGGCLKKTALILFILSMLSTVIEIIFAMIADL